MQLLYLPSLRYCRERAMFSQEALAERSGVSRSTIHKAEHGEDVYPGTARRLAWALNIDPNELTRRPPAEHPRRYAEIADAEAALV